MADSCRDCGGTDFETGDIGCQKFCVACGVVVENASSDLVSEATADEVNHNPSSNFRHYSSNLPDHYINQGGEKRIGKGVRDAMKKLQMYCRKMNLPAEMRQRADDILSKVFEIQFFKKKLQTKKYVLACACVYITCREFGWPSSMSDVISLTENGDKGQLLVALNEIREKLNIKVQAISHEARIKAECATAGITNNMIVEKITQLNELLKEFWLLEGRKPSLLLSVTSFIVCQSEMKKKLSISEHLKKYNFHTSLNVFRPRYREITDVLIEMAKNIPWLSGRKFTRTNVPNFLGEIFKNQKCLKYDIQSKPRTVHASPDLEDGANKPCSSAESSLCSIKNEISQSSENSLSSSDDVKDLDSQVKTNKDTDEMIAKLENTRKLKRKNFEWLGIAPPSYDFTQGMLMELKRRKITDSEVQVTHDLDKAEVDENDMLDSEVVWYMRTKKEIKLYKDLQAKD